VQYLIALLTGVLNAFIFVTLHHTYLHEMQIWSKCNNTNTTTTTTTTTNNNNNNNNNNNTLTCQ
jgi:hypothetical protein